MSHHFLTEPRVTRGKTRHFTWMTVILAATASSMQASGGEITLRDLELPTRLTVGYAVRLIDMNGDQRLDICIVDSERILWLENPNWNEHILIEKQTKKDNVCFAPYDIDGDGQLDFAVGADWRPADTETSGSIQWMRRGKTPDEKWTVIPIGQEPTVHRMNFADLDGNGKAELIVAPLMGRSSKAPNFAERGVRLLSYKIPSDPVKGPWTPTVINEDLHVTHNFQVTDMNGDKQPDILYVGFEGVHLLERQKDGPWTLTRIGTGNQETSPNRGASEIKHGRLASGQDYIATIEPWHGSQVVVYTRPAGPRPATGQWLWTRHILDEDLKWGHAVWCANLDGDEDQELVIGIRDNVDDKVRCGLRIYDPADAVTGKWSRQIVDPGSVAIEDLTCGDLNGDGRTDVVAVGRATHNVKIYWNETPAAK
jgi:aldos-2-ulose dehydratase/isomerase family protein/VCBS repeat protein